MKFKTLLSIITIGITFLFLPAVAGADEVPWTSVEYTATADAEIIDFGSDYQETIGPPLPAIASAYVEKDVYAVSSSSQVDSSTIDIDTWISGCG